MGMISKHIQGKKTSTDVEDAEARPKSVSGLLSSQSKDDMEFRSSASPSGSQYRIGSKSKRPAEVFRTDFITAMKIPDNQTLPSGRHYELVDPWRQEWERGVQVAVNPQVLPKTSFRKTELQTQGKRYDTFSLPKSKITKDCPELVHTNEKVVGCSYDLDDLDVHWLQLKRSTGKRSGGCIDECVMEKAMAFFEKKCFENMAHAVATKKGLSIEYDDSTTCDVCLSPDTEDSNEIVFCDACNMCVHQACYGIPEIPIGTWLCRPCSRGVLSPPCIICPNKGGALKRVKNSFEWIHVICAWWVPEVKIEDTENVEKMTVDRIPASRKNLCCSLCREKVGACIQCSVKRCVAAYHVTCAVKGGLEMKTVMMQDKDDVQHISHCKRHCIPQPPEKMKQRPEENVENQRLHELQKLQQEFFRLVDLRSAARELRLNRNVTAKLFGYWVLKRKANENRPLVPLTAEQQEKLSGKQGIFLIQEQINVEMERYALLRQDLERLRNLCYLIIRRERMKREVHKASQEVFYKQEEILSAEGPSMSDDDFRKIATDTGMTRFTKFLHYASDGPPFADHVGDVDQQGHKSPTFHVSTSDSELNPTFSKKEVGGPFPVEGMRQLFGKELNTDCPQGEAINLFSQRSKEVDCSQRGDCDSLLNGRGAALASRTAPLTGGNVDSKYCDKEGANEKIDGSAKDMHSNRFMEDGVVKTDCGQYDVSLTENEKIGVMCAAEARNIAIDEEMAKTEKKSTSTISEEVTSNAVALEENHKELKPIMSAALENKPQQDHAESGLERENIALDAPRASLTSLPDVMACVQDSTTVDRNNLMDVNRTKWGHRRNLSAASRSRRVLRTSARLKTNTAETDQSYSNDLMVNGGVFSIHTKSSDFINHSERLPSNPSKVNDLTTCSASNSSVQNETKEISSEPVGDHQIKRSELESISLETKPDLVKPANLAQDCTPDIKGPTSSLLSVALGVAKTVGGTENGRKLKENEISVLRHGCEKLKTVASTSESSLQEKGIAMLLNDYSCREMKHDCSIGSEVHLLSQDLDSDSISAMQSMECNIKRNNTSVSDDDGSLANEKNESWNQTKGSPQAENMEKGSKPCNFSNAASSERKKRVILERRKSYERVGNVAKNRSLFLNGLDRKGKVSRWKHSDVRIDREEVSANDLNEFKREASSAVYGSVLLHKSNPELDIKLARTSEIVSYDGSIFEAVDFNDAGKNPVVLLNELSNLNEITLKRPYNLNGVHDSPRKGKKLGGDIPSPAFPHSVIDDLVACPQRLTRGRTHLMMMGQNEDNGTRKLRKKRRKTVCGTRSESNIVTLSEEDSSVENFHVWPQRLTRKRLRSLGFEKSNSPDLDLINGLSKERTAVSIEAKTSPCGNPSGEIKDRFPDKSPRVDKMNALDVSPTRITRSRIKSLGLERSIEDLVIV